MSNPANEKPASGRVIGTALTINVEKHRARLEELASNPSLLTALDEPKTQDDWEVAEIVQLGLAIGVLLKRISEQAPSVGYERYLVSKGINQIIARGMALLAVKRGTRIAVEEEHRASVIRAIHFIRNPDRNKKALLRRVKLLLSAATETTTIETLFVELGRDEFHFVHLLQSANEGNDGAYAELAEIARGLPVNSRRGPRIKAASAAHEFFMEALAGLNLEHGYTWDPVKLICTDDLSEAARREFNLSNFDPRPAYRRLQTSSNNVKDTLQTSTSGAKATKQRSSN